MPINEAAEDMGIHKRQEEPESEGWMISMNDLDSTKQAKRWILEEQADIPYGQDRV